MAISLQTNIRQSLRQTLTPELRVGVELLNLTNLELAEKLQKELQENPVLEEKQLSEAMKLSPEMQKQFESKVEKANTEEFDPSYLNDFSYSSLDKTKSEQKQKFIEGSISNRETLSDHLMWQLQMTEVSDKIKPLVEAFITNLDDSGFFVSPPFAFLEDLLKKGTVSSFTESEYFSALNTLRNFDPLGIGVENIQESLIVQCQKLQPDDKVLLLILQDNFEEFTNLNYKKIAANLKVSLAEILSCARFIGSLDPHPGMLYNKSSSSYVYPDIAITEENGEFIVQNLDHNVPYVEINPFYKNLLQKKSTLKNNKTETQIEKVKKSSRKEDGAAILEASGNLNNTEREYVQDLMLSAQVLIKGLAFRQKSIVSVSIAILDMQKAWFLSGRNQDIKPMTLKDISEVTNLSESALSRVTAGKCIQTIWGVVPFKFFFSSGLKNFSGEKDSSRKIMDFISSIIKSEDGKNPLSDTEILELLTKQGIQVARRTIAKYRTRLSIPKKSARKKIFVLKQKLEGERRDIIL